MFAHRHLVPHVGTAQIRLYTLHTAVEGRPFNPSVQRPSSPFFFPPGAVHREGGEHSPAAQPHHRQLAHQEGLPADRAAGQGPAGGQPQRAAALHAMEALHVPQQEGQQEGRGESPPRVAKALTCCT